MQLETFQYVIDKGWSTTFPQLDSDQTLILVFAAPEFINHPEPILELAKHYPTSHIMGCSSAGEILGSMIFDHTLSVAVIRFDKTPLKIISKEIHQTDQSFDVGNTIAKELDQDDLHSIFVLSDGLIVNGSELVKGLNNINKPITITGGLAGDGDKFKKTWVIYQNKILTNHIVALGLYGKFVHIGHGSRGGWDIFGPERLITRAKNNILYELDHRPALSLYKEYLGERAEGLPATGLLFPLAIRSNRADERRLVRTILGVDEKKQSLIFAGDMPEGYLAQLMRANFDRLIAGANKAGELAKISLLENKNSKENTPILSIAISCVGRRLLLLSRGRRRL